MVCYRFVIQTSLKHDGRAETHTGRDHTGNHRSMTARWRTERFLDKVLDSYLLKASVEDLPDNPDDDTGKAYILMILWGVIKQIHFSDLSHSNIWD